MSRHFLADNPAGRWRLFVLVYTLDMNETHKESPDIFVDPHQEAKDLLVQWNEWSGLLKEASDIRARLARDDSDAEKRADLFLADVALKAEKKPQGETVYEQLDSAEALIRESAYKVEQEIAAARGVEFNPADPDEA